MLSHLFLPILVLVLAYGPMLLKTLRRRPRRGGRRRAHALPDHLRCLRFTVLLSITRRALPSTVAMFGTLFGYLLGGAVVVEELFGCPASAPGE